MNFDAFISHSSKDKIIADDICKNLESSGVSCWIAPRNILGGEKWEDAIKRGINNSNSMVLVFTSNSNASHEVLKEVILAIEANIPIIPFRIENITPSDDLGSCISKHQWLDAFEPPLEGRVDELSDSLCRLLHISKQTGIPRDAEEILTSFKWKFNDLVPAGDKEAVTIDALTVLGTTSFSEKGILVFYHLEGVAPSKMAFLDLKDRNKRIKWVYESPAGWALDRIIWSGPFLFLEEVKPRPTGISMNIVQIDTDTGAELAEYDRDIFKGGRWRKVRDLSLLRGESTIIHLDGRILEIATLKAPFVKIRWIAPLDSDIALVSTVAYPLMDSCVIVACHDLSLHCLRVYEHQSFSQPELNWFSVDSGAVDGLGLRVKCNKCNAIFEYDPREGDNPGNKCPSCDYVKPEFDLYGW